MFKMIFSNDRFALFKFNKKTLELIFKCLIMHEDQVKTCSNWCMSLKESFMWVSFWWKSTTWHKKLNIPANNL